MKKAWWHGAVAYQIYPKSFMDSNGDGIGDLRGIIGKLDYLQDLGVDILWLSPVYPSPLADEGYDISDYYGVDPRFGTLADMDELIAEAGKRGMKIVLDLVVNHCSDEHPWFRDVLENPDSKYREYFYIVDGQEGRRDDGGGDMGMKPSGVGMPADSAAGRSRPGGASGADAGGKRPVGQTGGDWRLTNWRSYFGGSVWEPLGDMGQWYLHSFHKKQPDLNWENPALREEVAKNVQWWLSRGVAGFRIDAIINIKKALPFKDYPADGPDGLCDLGQMLEDAHGIGDFLGELKGRAFAPHDAFTVGEVFNVSPSQMGEWIGEDGYFSSMFDFSGHLYGGNATWHTKPHIGAEDYKDCVFAAQEAAGEECFLSNIIENHDEPRGVNYYLPEELMGAGCELKTRGKKMLGGLYFLLRGIPFIYQGQELGMENTQLPTIDDVSDISSFHQYRSALAQGLGEEEAMRGVRRMSRDNARTPVQWEDAPHGGFTTGVPWMAANPNYKEINAAAQMDDGGSVRAFYKGLIALRKHPLYRDVLVYGRLEPYLREQKDLFAYERVGGRRMLVAGNFSKDVQSMMLPGDGAWDLQDMTTSRGASEDAQDMALPGYGERKCTVLMNNCDGGVETDGRWVRLQPFQLVVLDLG
jgi:oligo-1,6-glucosidase